ncbi:hypothetical protein PP753_gp63 [Dinoroseobacter phage vB_DshP-R7L]|uniref:Uncharacterized protein n=1 Tax=Dinoroseobacter phage vB_DshP-R7L TaxID=2873349 RepID=A0AAE8XBH7_9CAUD|nr:hypothetical protein PP753_gp63 [Dinoroseobacter phage vB_DshP-R7L]UAT28895.1 hypothetical protein R7L_gp56 [Dinoroseobacter phage vB_DshP-R7L]
MLNISYANVMNGLNHNLHMNCICKNMREVDYLFHNAKELWYVKGFSLVKRVNRSIEYGPVHNQLTIRFSSYEQIMPDRWRGFQGVFLIHPNLRQPGHLFKINKLIQELDAHNERYMEQWQS